MSAMGDLKHRAYSGRWFRPKPLIDFDEKMGCLLIVTPWSDREPGEKVIRLIKDHLNLSEDSPASRSEDHLEALGPIGNRLRSGVLLAHESLYENENSTDYSVSLEIAAISVQGRVLSWVQVGAPHLLLTSSKGLQPLCYAPDGAWQFGQNSPLWTHGLGVEKSVHLNCGSHLIQGGEKLILLSRSLIPSQFYSSAKSDINGLAQLLADSAEDMPFWIATLQL